MRWMKRARDGAAPETSPQSHRSVDLSIVVRRSSWLMIGLGWATILSAMDVLPAELSHGVPLAGLLIAPLLALGLFIRASHRRRLRLFLLATVEAVLIALMLPDMRDFLAVRLAGATLAGERSVSLVELNVWDLNRDPVKTIAWLRSTNADVIVLAEARESFVGELARAFPDYPTLVTCEVRPYCGQVVLSRFSGRLVPGGRWVADGYRHSAPGDQTMALAAVELDIPGPDGVNRPTPVVAVHLDRRGVSGVVEHQAESLLRAVTAASGRFRTRLILAGDFNASPWSPQMRRFDRTVGAERISAFAPTWPSALRLGAGFSVQPLLAIDHIYLGCAWKARQLRVGKDVGSDHRPLVARFDARAGATADCPNVREGPNGG